MNPELPIAIFDSGVGGLTVLQRAQRELPSETFVYYADTKHVPYGNRRREEIREYILSAAAFLASLPVKAMVIACNTATSSAVNELREQYDMPVIGMEPAVKPAVEKSNGKRVLVLATELTLKEQKFRDLVARVDNEKIVDGLAMPELVLLAEQQKFGDADVAPVLEKKLSGLDKNQYGTVVLGCTHFPFFREHLGRIFKADIIDGNAGTVRHLKNTLAESGLLRQGGQPAPVRYFNSGEAADAARYEGYLEFLKSSTNTN